MSEQERSIWTIGHWNVEPDAFLAPLRSAGIRTVADVRSLPGSRRSPQFDQEAMSEWLAAAGVAYRHLGDLGGRRRHQGIDPERNAGWESESFRNYADYTLSDQFRDGLGELEALAQDQPTVVMCGEPMPWRCHRSLIATALVVRGWTVWHLLHGAAPIRHELGRWGAEPEVGPDGVVTYPARSTPAHRQPRGTS